MREFAKNMQSEKRWVDEESGSHRTEHGGVAWAANSELIQPQDGAIDLRENARVTDISTRSQLGVIAMGEPEDARLTGSTRSLVRRMLGLNIAPRAPRKNVPAAVAKSVKPAKALIATGQVRVA